MNKQLQQGRTDIEFVVRPTIEPTPYPRHHRIADFLSGWLAGKHLSDTQIGTTGAAQQVGPVLLPAWAEARYREFTQTAEAEENLCTGIVDPYRIELAALGASLESLKRAATDATKNREHVLSRQAESQVKAAPGESTLSPEALATRRRREKEARDADAHASEKAAEAAVIAAEKLTAELTQRISAAESVRDKRINECREHTSRRLAVFAQGISRRHRNAPVIPALTSTLDLDNRRGTRPKNPTPGPTRPAALSVVRTE